MRAELAETAVWLDALYGKCTTNDGALLVVAPKMNRIYAAFRIGRGEFLVEAATYMTGTAGLYVKINPMDYDAILERGKRERNSVVGNQREVRTIVSFHFDVDAGKSDKYLSRSDALACLDAMPHKPTLIVNSDGDEGGFHAYWILETPYRIGDDENRRQVRLAAYRWQQRLRELAGGKIDSTANIDRVLRVVGGKRINGNYVTCYDYWPDRLYTLRDLWLPPTAKEKASRHQRNVEAIQRQHFGDIGNGEKPITAYLKSRQLTPEALLREAGYIDLGGGQWRRPDSQTGARTLKIATDYNGINVFSGGDPYFDCLDEMGRPGAFHSVEAMYVSFCHGSDWQAAGSFCDAELTTQMLRKVT